MKKVFLLFGMASFCSASAQQKDLFDIQKHLDNMIKDKKIPGGVFKPFNKPAPVTNYRYSPNVQKLSHILTNGDKVYILSLDNMPCLVPGFTQNRMPNIADPDIYFESPLFRNDSLGTMPNAVKPYRLMASK
jgi:hypothetical protein